MASSGINRQKDVAMHALLPTASASAEPGKSKPLLQHFEEFRTTRFFAYLTVITVIMFVINMVQIALLDRFNNRAWVLGFPVIVFVLLMSALLAWMFHTRRTLRRSWLDADRELNHPTFMTLPLALTSSGPTRVARIGIVCSVLLPIVCCEFLYLNLAAVPAIREKVWTTSLIASSELQAPSLILFQESWDADLNIEPNCVNGGPQRQPCLEPLQELNAFSFQHNDTAGRDGTTRYLHYDAVKEPVKMSIKGDGLLLSFDVVYLDPPHQFTDYFATVANDLLWFAVFDPRLTKDLGLAMDCGIVFRDLYPVNQSTAVLLYLEQATIADNVGAITLPPVSSTLTNAVNSCDAASFSNYNSYSYRMLELGGPPDIQSCTNSTSSRSCPFELGLTRSSTPVTQRTSNRGTNWLQMLLDEGSIVGGITFVTWFLSIYIV